MAYSAHRYFWRLHVTRLQAYISISLPISSISTSNISISISISTNIYLYMYLHLYQYQYEYDYLYEWSTSFKEPFGSWFWLDNLTFRKSVTYILIFVKLMWKNSDVFELYLFYMAEFATGSTQTCHVYVICVGKSECRRLSRGMGTRTTRTALTEIVLPRPRMYGLYASVPVARRTKNLPFPDLVGMPWEIEVSYLDAPRSCENNPERLTSGCYV